MPAEIRELEEHEMPEPMLSDKQKNERTNKGHCIMTVFSEDSQNGLWIFIMNTRFGIMQILCTVRKSETDHVSMVHLNPYTMIVNGYEVSLQLYRGSGNIEPDYRHQRIYAIALLETCTST